MELRVSISIKEELIRTESLLFHLLRKIKFDTNLCVMKLYKWYTGNKIQEEEKKDTIHKKKTTRTKNN